MTDSVKLSDIARELGVSTVTVSNALSGKKGLSDELRSKIAETSEKMGYVPLRKTRKNTAAASETQKIHPIGILIAEKFYAMTAFYGFMYRYVNAFLANSGCYAVFDILSREDEENLNLTMGIKNKVYDGIIIFGQISEQYLYHMLDYIDVPYQCLDFYYGSRPVDCILTDNFLGTYYLTKHLITHGHKNIGFIGIIGDTTSVTDRYFGYMRALLEHKLSVPEKWVLQNTDMPILQQLQPGKADMPTAFVCHCDNTACKAIMTLSDAGLHVPQDVSIVGYDDYIQPGWTTEYSITTYHYNVEQAAKLCVETLKAKIDGNEYRHGPQIVSGWIVERDSVKDLR